MLPAKQELKHRRADLALTDIMRETASLEDQRHYNTALLLHQQLQENARQRGLNLISSEEQNREKTRINSSVLALIDELPDGLILPSMPDGDFISNEISTPKRWWKGWGVVFGILAMLATVTGIALKNRFFQQPLPPVQVMSHDTLARPSVQISTTGDQSPAVNASGDVIINYGEPAVPKKVPTRKDSLSKK